MSIALFTLLIAVLTQVLGACYNYQFLNVLGVPLSVHPLTLEDNIQTALSQLPLFIATTVFPPILGFAVRYHTHAISNSISVKVEAEKKKYETKSIVLILKPLAKPVACAVAIFLCFKFLPFRTAIYANAYIGFVFVMNMTFDKIKEFSIKSDIAFSLFVFFILDF